MSEQKKWSVGECGYHARMIGDGRPLVELVRVKDTSGPFILFATGSGEDRLTSAMWLVETRVDALRMLLATLELDERETQRRAALVRQAIEDEDKRIATKSVATDVSLWVES